MPAPAAPFRTGHNSFRIVEFNFLRYRRLIRFFRNVCLRHFQPITFPKLGGVECATSQSDLPVCSTAFCLFALTEESSAGDDIGRIAGDRIMKIAADAGILQLIAEGIHTGLMGILGDDNAAHIEVQ